jgi:DNA repair protein RadC
VKLKSSNEVADYLKELYQSNGDDINVVEHVYVLSLNNANNVTGFMKLGSGTIASSVVDFRVLFKFVIDSLSVSFIVSHNHPSGSLIPSNADIELTKKLKEASRVLDLKLLDHIILSYDGHYSFANESSLL